MAAGKSTAADLGAYVCFEDGTGKGLSPPKGRTWAPRGARPVVRVRGRGRGRVNVAGVVCFRPGHRAHFFYKLHVYHGRKGEPKSFSWQDYRDLIVATHLQLGAPVVWCWDNLNVHLVQELYDFAEENKAWLRVFQMPSYAPELNPAEGVWSLLKQSIANFVAADLRKPHPHRQAQAQEDPVPSPSDRRLPRRDQADHGRAEDRVTGDYEFKPSTTPRRLRGCLMW
ncbi:transposase [Streptomyces sp. NPDC006012]|uniref:transposase n=1 Tax=Streptomyces sp. NPDC006012 TaxID=3364739 RepID=UPI0036AC7B69